MTRVGDKVFFSIDDLAGYGVSSQYAWDAIRRNREGAKSWHHIPDPQDARRKLIDFDSIPAETKRKYSLPSREELEIQLQRSGESQDRLALVDLHAAAINQDDRKVFEQLGNFTAKQLIGLMHSAAWLRLLTSVRGKKDVQSLKLLSVKTKEQLTTLALAIITDQAPYGLHRLSNLRVLKRYMTSWKKAQNESRDARLSVLVHGMRGNRNALKRTPEADQVLLSLYLGLDVDYKRNLEQIWETYTGYVNEAGCVVDRESGEIYKDLPSLSLSTIKGFLSKPSTRMLDKYRNGSKYEKDYLRPYIKGRPPQYSLSMSSSDGFVMPFWIKIDGKNTWKRPVCYIIFDVQSQAILGAALGMAEDASLMRAAFLDLVRRQNGWLPIQNQLDNFSKFFQDELEQLMNVKFCAPYNAQSKYAETFIGTLKYSFLNQNKGFIGRHSLRNETNKRNPDKGHPGDSDVCYSWEDMNTLLDRAIEEYNAAIPKARKGQKSRLELLSNRNPEAQQVKPYRAAVALGERVKATINRGYLRMTVNGETRDYRIDNYVDILDRLENGYKVRVRYLPWLLDDHVWLFNYQPDDDPLKDTFLCKAACEIGTQRAEAEQGSEDGSHLGRLLRWQRDYDEAVAEKVQTIPTSLEVEQEPVSSVLGSGYTDKPSMHEAEEEAEKGRISRWR